MATRYRVEEQVDFEGTATWYVIDPDQGDQPVAEFEDEESARDHASRLEAEDDATPATGDSDDVPPPVP